MIAEFNPPSMAMVQVPFTSGAFGLTDGKVYDDFAAWLQTAGGPAPTASTLASSDAATTTIRTDAPARVTQGAQFAGKDRDKDSPSLTAAPHGLAVLPVQVALPESSTELPKNTAQSFLPVDVANAQDTMLTDRTSVNSTADGKNDAGVCAVPSALATPTSLREPSGGAVTHAVPGADPGESAATELPGAAEKGPGPLPTAMQAVTGGETKASDAGTSATEKLNSAVITAPLDDPDVFSEQVKTPSSSASAEPGISDAIAAPESVNVAAMPSTGDAHALSVNATEQSSGKSHPTLASNGSSQAARTLVRPGMFAVETGTYVRRDITALAGEPAEARIVLAKPAVPSTWPKLPFSQAAVNTASPHISVTRAPAATDGTSNNPSDAYREPSLASQEQAPAYNWHSTTANSGNFALASEASSVPGSQAGHVDVPEATAAFVSTAPSASDRDGASMPFSNPQAVPAVPDRPLPNPDAVTGVVQVARLVDGMGKSEMHIDMRTQAFGEVEVHTVLRESQLGLTVGSEKGDLRGFLAPEVPSLQAMVQQHDLRFDAPQYLDHSLQANAGFTGSQDSQSHSRPQGQLPSVEPAPPNTPTESLLAEEGVAAAAPGLSVHA